MLNPSLHPLLPPSLILPSVFHSFSALLSVSLLSVCLSVSLHPEVPVWLREFIDFWELGESGRQGWGADSGMEIEGYKLFVTGKQ